MIDVVEVIADSSLSGGPKHVLTLVKALSHNLNIVTVCPEGYLPEQIKQSSLKSKIINFKNIFDLRSIRLLRRYIKTGKPKIIHAHGVRAGIITYFSILFLGSKFIYTEHLYTDDYHLDNPVREILQLFLLGFVLRRANVIVAPSQAVKRFLTNRFFISKNKVLVIANGIDDFKVETKNKTKPTVGFIGGMSKTKGLPILLSAMTYVNSKNSDVKLEIIGDVPASFESSANIEVLGPSPDVSKIISSWDALVVPSISESFGQVVLEAAVAGVPVIASHVGGLPEIVEQGYNGIFFDKDNSQSLASAILRVAKESVNFKKMGENNRKLYERKFTSQIMASNYLELYGKIIGDENKKNN